MRYCLYAAGVFQLVCLLMLFIRPQLGESDLSNPAAKASCASSAASPLATARKTSTTRYKKACRADKKKRA
ncbi:unnamed protein product [Soboliphyme baturini]|uniref:Secreted protein n=1 Tax=Soboliphyme baturini TaxID=241478 RepID=A0A183J0T7_9BILA|nr:unnamed protein product [Soboliphyme baturini]